MNKKETKTQAGSEVINGADEIKTTPTSPFVDYMRKVVDRTSKKYPNRFLLLVASDFPAMGETADIFATVPKQTKVTAGILASLMVHGIDPLIESLVLAIHSFIGDQLGESYRDEFDACVSGIFKRAKAEMEAKTKTEVETSTDEN